MRYSIPTTPDQMRETRDWSHECVLYSSFPAFDGDHIGHTFESDAEVRPDRSSNQQVHNQEICIDL